MKTQRLNYALAVVVFIMAVAALLAERDDILPASRHSTGSGALGPPVTFSLPIGGRSAWGYPTKVQSHFYDAWRGSFRSRCKHPTSPETWAHGLYQQTFQYCVLVEPPARILSVKPTPITQPIIPGPVGPTVTPVPVATAAPSTPNGYELSLMNATRTTYGLPAYTEDSAMSNGASSCIGALGHSQHMAQTHQLAHDQFPADNCGGSYSEGENIGYWQADVDTALRNIHALMMSEPWTPGCQGNHACSILSNQFTRVGIGVFVGSDGTVWLTVDFAA